MSKLYHEKLDRIRLTEESKNKLIASLTQRQGAQSCSPSTVRSRKRTVIAAAAAACLLIGSAAAAALATPVLREHYQNSAGYAQSSVELGESVTSGGWTMTLTDSVMDAYNIYIGIELTAPGGTILGNENGYSFADWGVDIAGLEAGGSSYYTRVDDDDPTDNSISFVLWSSYAMDEGLKLDGAQLSVRFGGLYHSGEWNGELEEYEKIYDCKENWEFTTCISMPESSICVEPDVTVTTLGVEAVVTSVEVSPIGVYVYIEGDALKGHHSWVEKNAHDGWYVCVEYQEITVYLTDGTAIPMTDGLEGSGCSGGTDSSEVGYLHLARRADMLLDLDTIDHISVCGVNIPLR